MYIYDIMSEVHSANEHNVRTHTMMLLIGMWMSFTKNPMKPIIANPIAVARAIFWNSKVCVCG